MSLLSVCQNVAAEAGFEVPPSVFNQPHSEIAVRLFGLARRSSQRLARRHEWTMLRRQAQIVTRTGQGIYRLPDDYGRMITSTAWDTDNSNPLWGPLTPAQWQFRKNGITVRSHFSRTFRIMANGATKSLYVNPVPASVDTLVFEYISNNFVLRADGDLASSFADDEDTLVLDEELWELDLLWRFLQRSGLPFQVEAAEFTHALDQAIARDGAKPVVSLAKDAEIVMPNLPEGHFGPASAGSAGGTGGTGGTGGAPSDGNDDTGTDPSGSDSGSETDDGVTLSGGQATAFDAEQTTTQASGSLHTTIHTTFPSFMQAQQSFQVGTAPAPEAEDEDDDEPIIEPPSDTGIDTIISSTRRVDWTQAGVAGGIPTNYPEGDDVVADHGADDTGNADASGAFQDAIDAAVAPTVITIPAGTFLIQSQLEMKSGVVLRGASDTATILKIDHGDHGIEFAGSEVGDEIAATSGYTKGNSTLTLADASSFSVGDYGQLFQDNNGSVMYTDPAWNVDWAQEVMGQVFKVTAKDGNTLTVELPWMRSLSSSRNPRVQKMTMVEDAGLENMTLERVDNTSNMDMVLMLRAAGCWIQGVHSKFAVSAHVAIDYGYRCTIRHNFFDRGQGSGGHRLYGTEMGYKTTACLIEDNIYNRLGLQLLCGRGAIGNVFGYNYCHNSFDESYTREAICIHGHQPAANLWEGNWAERSNFTDHWGPAGPWNTMLRNHLTFGFDALQIRDSSNFTNAVGNTLTDGFIELEDVNESSLLLHANEIDGEIEYNASFDEDYGTSLYHESRPDFYTDQTWPSIGAGVANPTIPAKDRFDAGDEIDL